MQNEQLFLRRAAPARSGQARHTRRGEHIRAINPNTGNSEIQKFNDVPQALTIAKYAESPRFEGYTMRQWLERFSVRLVKAFDAACRVDGRDDYNARLYWNGLKFLDEFRSDVTRISGGVL